MIRIIILQNMIITCFLEIIILILFEIRILLLIIIFVPNFSIKYFFFQKQEIMFLLLQMPENKKVKIIYSLNQILLSLILLIFINLARILIYISFVNLKNQVFLFIIIYTPKSKYTSIYSFVWILNFVYTIIKCQSRNPYSISILMVTLIIEFIYIISGFLILTFNQRIAIFLLIYLYLVWKYLKSLFHITK